MDSAFFPVDGCTIECLHGLLRGGTGVGGVTPAPFGASRCRGASPPLRGSSALA
jgi:hypothetical protein